MDKLEKDAKYNTKLYRQINQTNQDEHYDIYKQIRKEGTNLIKEKKLKWIEIMDELEKEDKYNRKLCRQINKQKRKNAITRINKNQWQDFLESLANIEEDTSEEERDDNPHEEVIREPTVEEVNSIMDDRKNGNVGKGLRDRIYELLLKIWQKGIVPEEWRLGIIILVPKYGD